MCMILTYEHVYVLSHLKYRVFIASNERTVKKFNFNTVYELTAKRTNFLDHFKDTI
jgi:hypothetical protein